MSRSVKDLISVIMPSYNAATHIAQSIQSVINQSICNWELIVINDGSTDITEDIVREFSKVDERINLVTQVNYGVARARNRGIEEAHGEFVAFLDSDDTWDNDFLKLSLVNITGKKMLFSRYRLMNNNNQSRPRLLKRKGDIKKLTILKNNAIGTLTVFLRREVLLTDRFDQNFHGPEDWDLWLVLANKYDWHFSNFCAANYRIHSAGISRSAVRMYKQERRVIKKHTGKSGATLEIKAFLYLRFLRRLLW